MRKIFNFDFVLKVMLPFVLTAVIGLIVYLFADSLWVYLIMLIFALLFFLVLYLARYEITSENWEEDYKDDIEKTKKIFGISFEEELKKKKEKQSRIKAKQMENRNHDSQNQIKKVHNKKDDEYEFEEFSDK